MKIYVEIIAVCNKKNRFRLISEKSENAIEYVKICWFNGDTCIYALKRHLLESVLWRNFNVVKQLSNSYFPISLINYHFSCSKYMELYVYCILFSL